MQWKVDAVGLPEINGFFFFVLLTFKRQIVVQDTVTEGGADVE